MNRNHVGGHSNQRDRHKIFLRPWQLGCEVGVTYMVSRVRIKQGVSVWRSTGNALVSNIAATASPVVYHYGLSRHLGQGVRKYPGGGIDKTARRVGHDQCDGLARVGLG